MHHFFLRTRNQHGFTLIEVLIAILIFGLGLLSAFVLSSSANSLSLRSKQEIIATNLLREQIEVFKNIRDTNFLALRDFDSLRGVDPGCIGADCKIEFGYAVLGTRYAVGASPTYYRKNVFSGMADVPSRAPDWSTPSGSTRAHQKIVSAESLKLPGTTSFRYCLDQVGRYRLDCDSTMKLTPYYGFMLVQPLMTGNGGSTPFAISGAFRITAYFATTEGGYREMAISTIVTDFKK